MYFCQLIKKSYLSFAPIHSPWLETEQVRERVSPMFTGFETALIEEYPGLSERKEKCLPTVPVYFDYQYVWKEYGRLKISPFYVPWNVRYLTYIDYNIVSFIYLLLKNLWTYKPINMRCVIHHCVLLFVKRPNSISDDCQFEYTIFKTISYVS